MREKTIYILPSVSKRKRKVSQLFGGLLLCNSVSTGTARKLSILLLHHIKISTMLCKVLLDLQRITAGQYWSFTASAWVIRTSGDDNRQTKKNRKKWERKKKYTTAGKQKKLNGTVMEMSAMQTSPYVIITAILESWFGPEKQTNLNTGACAGLTKVRL